MDPSSHNWIAKYLQEHAHSKPPATSLLEIYSLSRETGFALGHTVRLHDNYAFDYSSWTPEELSKVALISTMHHAFVLLKKDNSSIAFIEHLNLFYQNIHESRFSLTGFFGKSQNKTRLIESIIEERIQTKNKIINKNFYHIASNAILFSDVLAFIKYLDQNTITTDYFSKFELAIVSVVSIALQKKQQHNSHDIHFIKLFEDSLRLSQFENTRTFAYENIDVNFLSSEIERFYLLDLCILCLYTDTVLDAVEKDTIHSVATVLNIPKEKYIYNIESVHQFIENHSNQIHYFDPKNPVKNFYDHTTKSILLLLKRNKKKIIKELSNNKDLMILASKSTLHTLNKEEKERLKKHTINLCKTIPALTIFLLPGGSLILPILIKFIPQLLPSSFNENLD